MSRLLDRIEVITLFVDDIDEAKAFYQKVFAPESVYEDAVSSVLKFSGTMVNQTGMCFEPEPPRAKVRSRSALRFFSSITRQMCLSPFPRRSTPPMRTINL